MLYFCKKVVLKKFNFSSQTCILEIYIYQYTYSHTVPVVRSGNGVFACSQWTCQVPHYGCSRVQPAFQPAILHPSHYSPAKRDRGCGIPVSLRFRPDPPSGAGRVVGRGGLYHHDSPRVPVRIVLLLLSSIPGFFGARA